MSVEHSAAVVSLAIALGDLAKRDLVDRALLRSIVESRTCLAILEVVGELRRAGENARADGLAHQVRVIRDVGGWDKALAGAADYAHQAWAACEDMLS